MKIKDLINQLKELEDFEIDCRIERELTEDELKDSIYPYPYELTRAEIELVDVGYSDKIACIHVRNIENK